MTTKPSATRGSHEEDSSGTSNPCRRAAAVSAHRAPPTAVVRKGLERRLEEHTKPPLIDTAASRASSSPRPAALDSCEAKMTVIPASDARIARTVGRSILARRNTRPRTADHTGMVAMMKSVLAAEVLSMEYTNATDAIPNISPLPQAAHSLSQRCFTPATWQTPAASTMAAHISTPRHNDNTPAGWSTARMRAASKDMTRTPPSTTTAPRTYRLSSIPDI